MPRIALVSFVPILHDFDRGQRDGRSKRGETQLFGKEDRQIGRYCCDAIGPRNDEHRDNETGQAQQNIICRIRGPQTGVKRLFACSRDRGLAILDGR